MFVTYGLLTLAIVSLWAEQSLADWANLFFTCVAEEAVFRGFVQKHFTTALSGCPYGPVLAVLVGAILFGLAHLGGGARYVLLATLAGTGYGWAYQSTRRIEASILLHFLVNLTHVLWFSYPALRSSVTV